MDEITGGQGGLSIFGSAFNAQIDFNRAIRDADTLDRQLQRIAQNVRWLGGAGAAHINAFAAAMSRAAAAGGFLLNASGGILAGGRTGIASGGGGNFGPYSHLGSATPIAGFLPGAFQPQQPQYGTAPRTFYGVPPSISSAGVIDPIGQYNTRLPPQLGGAVVSPRGVIGNEGIIDVGYRVVGSGTTTPGGPTAIVPYAPPAGGGGGAPPFFTTFAPGMPSSGFRMPHMGGFYGPASMIQAGFTGPVAGVGRGFGRALQPFSYQNIMRVAGAMYVGQHLGNMAAYAGRQTIGQAMYLEERQALLQNALMSPVLGIDRDLAAVRADSLTSASYFAGMPTTAQEMGLSRPELAEQFRQLAPIIRLTARTQDEFTAGLQTGALARALLVARDPVQGTKGAMVALSELYSGGPDRFRSLALRFELPRNRMREIEEEMGGPDVADPGQVIIQMLNEMGFGPDYLTMRAGTLAGQLDRSGALASNFQVELYNRSMEKVRDNLTSLNDAFESFLDSDAGDRAIGTLNNIFGAITGWMTGTPTNLLVGARRNAGAMVPDRLAGHITDYMQIRGGSYVNASGQMVEAAEAFREAALVITGKDFEQALRAPRFNPTENLAAYSMLATLGGIGVTSVADRVLAGGLMGQAARQTFTGGGGALAARGLASAAGAALPVMAIAGASALAVSGFQTFNGARDWRAFAAANPEIAARIGVDPNIGGYRMWTDRLATWVSRAQNPIGTLFGWNSRRQTLYETTGTAIEEGNLENRLAQQAALLSLGVGDSNVVRSQLVAQLAEFAAANPDSRWADESLWGDMINRVMGSIDAGGAGEILTGVALATAARSGLSLVGGGNTYATDPAALLASGGAAGLWQTILGDAGGDSDKALTLLTDMLETMTGVEINTSQIAEATTANFLRPSGQGDIFTGFTADPDMRFSRRSGVPLTQIPTGQSAKASGALAIGSGAVSGAGTHVLSVGAATDYLDYNSYLGGIVTDLYGGKRGRHRHGGIDYVDSDGLITAPYAGTVEYLRTAEDYARYAEMFPGGAAVYGNTAVFRDELGLSVSTYSHLSDATFARYGTAKDLKPGQAFGIQGNTGQVKSDHGGDGTHVHQELWMSDGAGGYYRIDPLAGQDLYENLLPAAGRTTAAGGTINIEIEGKGVINVGGTPEEITQQIIDDPGFFAALFQKVKGLIVRDAADEVVNQAERNRARQGAR